jgi:hypothetical protein
VEVMIRYKVKPDLLEQHLELTRDVYEELASAQPGGVRQATFQFEDGLSFVMFVAFVETEDGRVPGTQLPTFQRYRSTLDERCTEPPVVTALHEVGSFHFHPQPS